MSNGQQSRANLAPKFPLNVLLVEDNPADAELCIEFLNKAQFDLQFDLVTTAEEFASRTSETDYDIILADYNLGCWTGMDALDVLERQGRDIPFILLTTALGEQTAVECMKRGIADYVLKDRMDRLPVAIYRALEQKAVRNECRRSALSLEESEGKFRALADAIPTAVFLQQGTRCRYVNRAAETLTGFSRADLLAMNFSQLIPEGARKVLAERFSGELDADGSRVSYETRILTREGDRRFVEVTVGMLQVEGKLTALISAVDLTSQREVSSHRIVSSSVHNGDEIGSDISIEKLGGCPARDAQFLRVVQANAL
jgi:PAS domain S-box-containing protein